MAGDLSKMYFYWAYNNLIKDSHKYSARIFKEVDKLTIFNCNKKFKILKKAQT